MSFPEIPYRLFQGSYALAQRRGFFTAANLRPANLSRTSTIWIGDTEGVDSNLYLNAAQEILAGRLSIFAIQNANLGCSPQWNRNPITGKDAPLVFGPRTAFHSSAVDGDIKYLWELNRHLHLVTLAQAYRLSQDPRYLYGMRTQLMCWFDQCPYLLGPNWISALEVGVRLTNWSIIWNLIDGLRSPVFEDSVGESFLSRWLKCIYQHMHFLRHHLSFYSSANNHLIGETAGLFVATITWPFWKDCQKWQELAYETLVREALLQNSPDGVNREQTIWYQHFVLDFMLISALAGRANGIEFPRAYWDRTEAMLEYIASVMDVGGRTPMIGDADDGHVVRLSQEKQCCPYRSLLATGAVLFARGDFKEKARHLDDKTRWLVGKHAARAFAAIRPKGCRFPVRREFRQGGYYVLGCDFETPEEIRLVVDAGPLGYRSIAAHGHADALAFTLSIGGFEFLIDPGTYCYHCDREWRDYFRGTGAHNTIRLDKLDQSTIGGPFLWTHKANATCEVWEPGDVVDRFVGTHDGYRRLRDQVIHRREIRLFKKERKIIVKDTLECRKDHSVERFWHFAETCQVSSTQSKIVARNGPHSLRMYLPDEEVQVKMRRGTVSPPSGWVSRRYDVKIPTTTLIAVSQINGTATLLTEINCAIGARVQS